MYYFAKFSEGPYYYFVFWSLQMASNYLGNNHDGKGLFKLDFKFSDR